MWLDDIVKNYVQSEWLNNRRMLNEPAAKEELLSGAVLYSFSHGATTPENLYSGNDFITTMTNPVVFDSKGEIGEVYAKKEVDLMLYGCHGNVIAAISNVKPCGII